MGLAERFRGKLNTTDIYTKPEETTYQTQTIEPDPSILKKFEDLETDTINKIRTTPYWQDYPISLQENMISKYFDNKIKTKYSNISYTKNEKQGFIKNILAFANHK